MNEKILSFISFNIHFPLAMNQNRLLLVRRQQIDTKLFYILLICHLSLTTNQTRPTNLPRTLHFPPPRLQHDSSRRMLCNTALKSKGAGYFECAAAKHHMCSISERLNLHTKWNVPTTELLFSSFGHTMGKILKVWHGTC